MKPTKVTKDDIELADELSRITTIKGLLERFSSILTQSFADLSDTSFYGNPVATHIAIQDKWDTLEGQLQLLAAALLEELGQVEEADAREIAAAQPEDESVPDEIPSTIDEALLGKHNDEDDGTIGVGEPK